MAAWIIGWDLTLEYAISCAAVARGWAGYANDLLDSIFQGNADWLSNIPISGGLEMCPLAAVFVGLCTILLLMGVKDSARDRKSGSAGMPRPISYAVFCLKKKKRVPS
eukprot:TRINITY_DN1837_c0_g1_i1.p1 TRINITY_DN1837_c0_g1~~TRINITY_DN1837_c0_g1_i1.p1  ORF type:complete len:108 (-),score=19.04 TRINITY_DN1837_c0_g1_i1:60-383(-)